VRLVLEPDSVDGTVSGDTDRLNQVFTNLLSNAAKFSPSGDKVDIRIGRQANTLRVSVIDHGPGIPDGFRRKIFQKFAQADSNNNRRIGGTGLGLSIVRSIVEKHGGLVSFDSIPGQGAQFHVDLPIWEEGVEAYSAEPPAKEVADEENRKSGHGPLRVLHVEDDEDVRRIVRLALDGIADIVAAHSMAMARQRLDGGRFDLVILDVSLPDGNGLDLLPLNGPSERPVSVIIFSAQDPATPPGVTVEAVLVKSRASTAELTGHVRRVAQRAMAAAEPERSA
jgi:CheY-like chemotaxis protein